MRPAAKSLQPWQYASFGLLLIVGCILRFWKLTGVGFWYDELWTVVGASGRPFGEMYREWILGDDHPPAFFIANFLWFKIVPATEFWARVPHALLATATVVYVLFRTGRVLNRDERLLSACFFCLCSFNIHFGLEVKQYSAVMLLATIATVYYLEIVQAGAMTRRMALVFTASCIAMAHLNYFAMAYAGLLLSFLAVTLRRNTAALRQVLLAGAAIVASLLPIAYFVYLQLKYPSGGLPAPPFTTFVSDLLTTAFFRDGWILRGFLAALLIALAIAGPGTWRSLATARNRHIALIFLAMTGFMCALGLVEPIFQVRYFLLALPTLLLGMGVLVATVCPPGTWRAAPLLVFFTWWLLADAQSVAGLRRQEWDRSVDFVLSHRQNGDRIYVLGADSRKTSFDYLRERNFDGQFYVKNLKFYEYYFRRRGASDVASSLEVVQPKLRSARELANSLRGTGTTVYILAGHHLEFDRESWKVLQRAARRSDVEVLYNALVYIVSF